RAIIRMYGPLLSELGLTYPQYLVLLILWEDDNIEVNRITERLHMDTGTVSPMLKRLESAGLIKRCRSMEDERKVIISLTSKGLKLKEKALAVPAELFCKTGLLVDEYRIMKNNLFELLKRIEDAESCKKNK
ncbi:MAG TPA: MarR family transcriptional regulator, partial [Spirochaetota bacterium]|nr:MarR family transcriptional regulator [Spirochaetota bacterium]